MRLDRARPMSLGSSNSNINTLHASPCWSSRKNVIAPNRNKLTHALDSAPRGFQRRRGSTHDDLRLNRINPQSEFISKQECYSTIGFALISMLNLKFSAEMHLVSVPRCKSFFLLSTSPKVYCAGFDPEECCFISRARATA